MVAHATVSRLKYLKSASECLLVSSPAVSTFLQAEHNAALETVDHGTDDHAPSRSCNTCGNILIPGWSCGTVKNKQEAQAKSIGTDRQRDVPKLTKLCCSRCGRITTFQSHKARQDPAKEPFPAQKSSKVERTRRSNTLESAPQLKRNEVKASSRRARTKKATLQSMLANHNGLGSKKPGGFGLDLSDLMKG